MVLTCCVVGCHNRDGRDKVSFYHIPAVRNHQGEETAALSSKRRLSWVARITSMCRWRTHPSGQMDPRTWMDGPTAENANGASPYTLYDEGANKYT